MKSFCRRGCVFLLSALVCACGLEENPYISPVPTGNITRTFNDRAVVRLPGPGTYDGTSFTHFEVFYRIYVSNIPQASTGESTYSSINSTLASDYNSIRTYIDSTTVVTVNMDSLFQQRGYRPINLENNSVGGVLSPAAQGSSITFDFSSSKAPTMSTGEGVYTLLRSNGGGLFTPQPDRYFYNTPELSQSENISSTINADVVNKSDIAAGDPRYTYAALFITAAGVNQATYSNIYSTPALVHVFQLPNR